MNQENGNVEERRSLPARKLRPGYLIVLCLVVGMGAGILYDRITLLAYVPANAISSFHLIADAWDTIERYYVDRSAVKPKTMTYGAISGMVAALGDTGHSTFLSPGMVKYLRVIESGHFKGVGVTVQMKNGHVVIISPLDNSPAQRAGLRSGEIIMGVNGKEIAGLSLDQVVERITGPAGTSVELSILDPKTHRIRKVKIVRATIHLKTVTWQQLPGTEVADVRISSFDEGVAGELRKVLTAVEQQNMRGIILDLRNNPGGVLDEAVEVASQFLSHGNVLLVKDAKGKISPVPVKPGGLAPKIPMAVLINGGSASAAEIVAGALKDAKRAMLIGETTFGTGTVLNQFPLPDGSALLLAVQEWLTPNGHSFWHKGIQPELKVSLTDDSLIMVPMAERHLTANQLKSSDDKQLLAALKQVTEQIQGHGTNQMENSPGTNAPANLKNP